jgi:cation diffusion facilitator CzcD-associated flavoprotein CzcO
MIIELIRSLVGRSLMSGAKKVDAVIIGAGISGMYQLHKLRKIGLTVKVYEGGTGVGGTWYWNRYPGARFDSESVSYGYSFSEELLQEWNWKERFSPQPDNLEYLEYVADKFDLRKDIQFSTRVTSAHYGEEENEWSVATDDGQAIKCQFLITAVGVLSTPFVPEIKGLNSFQGASWHTANWPKEHVGFEGKKVGVIGTGATAVQLIQEVAKTAGQLTVFQRTANFCKPLGNSLISDDEQEDIKKNYPKIFQRCRETFGSFLADFEKRSAFDVTPEEREARYEELWNEPGFGFWLGTYEDILTDPKANETQAEFARKKIRSRVNDPKVAEMLCPTSHPIGTKRMPLETGYYEVYNQPNVELVDIKATPIEVVTESSLKTTQTEYEFDMLILATGFDTVTGSLDRIDIRGSNGVSLKEKWVDGPRTYLGMGSSGFPNLFTLVGPHNGATFCNIPRCIEQNVEWVSDCIEHMTKNDIRRIEPNKDAEDKWTEHVQDVASGSLLTKTDSWFMGANIPGKPRQMYLYAGGSPLYRKTCDDVAENNYEGYTLQK